LYGIGPHDSFYVTSFDLKKKNVGA